MRTLEKSTIDRLKFLVKNNDRKQNKIKNEKRVNGLKFIKYEKVKLLWVKRKNKIKDTLRIEKANQCTPITSIEYELGIKGMISRQTK